MLVAMQKFDRFTGPKTGRSGVRFYLQRFTPPLDGQPGDTHFVIGDTAYVTVNGESFQGTVLRNENMELEILL